MSLSSIISGFFTTSSNAPSGSSEKATASSPGLEGGNGGSRTGFVADDDGYVDPEKLRLPIAYSMIAGGIGGCTGDMLMHSLDTVKTRQQGAPHVLKYENTGLAFRTIFREEGLRRGLYGGVVPAFLGSLPGTVIFFGTYEYSKRALLDAGCPEHLAYLTGGFLGDLFASIIYVPSEVLKTRLQLQGRYNNPHFHSGYNYRSTLDAARTIAAKEGFPALFYGYKATLMRDLPFSALQFAFYEQFQKWAHTYRNSHDIGLGLEILTGGAAGGLAGALTCPLDVVKTRIQTQIHEPTPTSGNAAGGKKGGTKTIAKPAQARGIATSSPTTHTAGPAEMLKTSSILRGLVVILKSEGVVGWFRGVGPRVVWTSVQSGTMLVLYQVLLKKIAGWAGEEVVLEGEL